MSTAGFRGLVTIEDVIEQIVGEIDDEFDVEDDQNIRKEAEHQFTVRGVTRIEEFNEYFGTALRRGGLRYGRRARHEEARPPAAARRVADHRRLRISRGARRSAPRRQPAGHRTARHRSARERSA